MDNLSEDVQKVVASMSAEWFKVLSPVIKSPKFNSLCQFVNAERSQKTIYPPEQQVFSWSNMTRIKDIKVVIIGQDPYHGPNQAHGLCFSVLKPTPPPPSLINIYKEISNCLNKEWPNRTVPKSGDLTNWATQGVFLLNAVLTVEKHKANSHQNKGWEELTSAVIKHISDSCNNVVFMLWGAFAQKQGASISRTKHLILQAPHPSPLSAHRGFLGCGHFKQANEYLQKNNRPVIDWMNL